MTAEREIWYNKDNGELVYLTWKNGSVERLFFQLAGSDAKAAEQFDLMMYENNGYSRVRTY